MGFLEAGTPMEWENSKEYYDILDYVKTHGVLQFLQTWRNVKSRRNDSLLWGDEIEFHLFRKVTLPDGTVVLRIVNEAHNLLAKLEAEDLTLPESERTATWHPEYGAWMVEATPSTPYGGLSDELRRVEPNMRVRRFRITRALGEGEGVLTLVAWPLMGVGEFCVPAAPPGGPVSTSNYIPDSCINPHPRFATLTRNIRKRRGQKVAIQLPLYIDENTQKGEASRTHEITSRDNLGKTIVPEVYMDAMGFGMGCCCLQVTFQARDLEESRHLYDQLAILCPIFLALTAGAPIFKGLLCDTDVRWSTICQSVDCRTPVEAGAATTPISLRDGELPQRGTMKIRKSRYDSVDLFISNSAILKDAYNDVGAEVDTKTYDMLVANEVDERLARHIAHLWIRDPLVIFSDRIEVNDKMSTEHFENLQSTNWQTMRWKPPPPNSRMGWRVEFRPMEVQFTDFENAAFTVVITLLARVILFFDLNMYIPLSKVDENMKRAHSRDAVLNQKFYFRRVLIPLEAQCDTDGSSSSNGNNGATLHHLHPILTKLNGSVPSPSRSPTPTSAAGHVSAAPSSSDGSGNNGSASVEAEYTEMSIRDILLGMGKEFPGLIPLIWAYLDIIGVDEESRAVIEDYIRLVVERAKGELPTPARWIRDFVSKHPEYKKDSVITEGIARDLVLRVDDIANGRVAAPELLGEHRILPVNEETFHADMEELRNRRDKGMRLRGASFQDDVGITKNHAYQCAIVRALVEEYTSQPSNRFIVSAGKGFEGTSSFLKDKLSQMPRGISPAKQPRMEVTQT